MSAVQIAVLMWTHCAIGWGFFIFQFWIPTYLSALGAHDLESMGMLSALPWAVSSHPCLRPVPSCNGSFSQVHVSHTTIAWRICHKHGDTEGLCLCRHLQREG